MKNIISAPIFVLPVQYTWDRDRSIKCAIKIYKQPIILLKSSNGTIDNEHPASCIGLRRMTYFARNAISTLSFNQLSVVYLLSCQPRVTVTSFFVYKIIRDL